MSKALWVSEENLWDEQRDSSVTVIVVIAFLTLSIIFYYRRRHLFPLKGRGTRAILFTCVLYLIVLISTAAQGPGWPCLIQLMVFSIGSHCGCAVYVYRIVVLLVKNDIANEIHFGPSIRFKRRSFLHDPRFIPFLKFRRYSLVLIAYGVLVGVVMFGMTLAMGDSYTCRGSAGLYSNVALVVIMAPIMSVLSWKLRKYPSDGRKISVEFRVMAFCIVAALVIQIILSQLTTLFSGSIILAVVGLELLLTSLLYPIYLSYGYANKHHSSDNSSTTSTSKLNLDDLLQSEDFREAFLVHLKGEFNAESLVFWQAVTTFKAKGERPVNEMIVDVEELFNTYLAPSAPYLLNTSLDSIEATRELFKQAQAAGIGFLTVFDSILLEVVALMKSDPLPRFLRTPRGREFGFHMPPSRNHSTRHSASHPSDHSAKRPSLSGSSIVL